MQSETVTYEADGLSMKGRLFRPRGGAGPHPGVLVFPEAPGLGEHPLSQAERLAGLGYMALACDLHGDGRVLGEMEKIMAALGALIQAPARIRARAGGALDALLAQPGVDAARIAAIGYCFGGTMALELACAGAPIAAAVGFHSGLAPVTIADAGAISGKVLVCLGADDPMITLEHRAAFEAGMRMAGVDWQMHLYGGVVHGFTNPKADAAGRPDILRYDARAAARAWKAMIGLFDETLATSAPRP